MYAWLRVVFYALYLARTRLCGCTCIHFKHEYVRTRSNIHLNILYTRMCCARVVGIACVVGRAQRREIRQVLLSFLATPSRLRNKYPTFNTAWATERHAQCHEQEGRRQVVQANKRDRHLSNFVNKATHVDTFPKSLLRETPCSSCTSHVLSLFSTSSFKI